MPAEREPEASIVERDVFRFRRRDQLERLFSGGSSGERTRQSLNAKRAPLSCAAMACEALECSRTGELLERAAFECGAGAELIDMREQTVAPADGFNHLPLRFGQA